MTGIGVVGAGQMGRGIAQVAAQRGFDVVIVDADPALAAAGVATIDTTLARLVEKGRLPEDEHRATLARMRSTSALADLADCDLVVEAAPEVEHIKFAIFEELDAACGPATILATNTSSIPVGRIAEATDHPNRVIGMHFMNPVPLMELVEIIRGPKTDDATAAAVADVAAKLGKTSIHSSDTAGFIVNRILLPFLNEAYIALESGVGSVEDIDTGARLGLNHRMGPLELSDHIGLDTCLAVLEVLHRDLGDERYRPAAILAEHVANGRLGRKSGAGFYDYDAAGGKQ